MKFKPGDKVYYIGSNRMLQRDYGKRELTIFAVDPKTNSLVCTTSQGYWLVGVHPSDVQPVESQMFQVGSGYAPDVDSIVVAATG